MGFVAGAALSFYVWLRESPPQYIERKKDGAQGERWTAKVLVPLEGENWFVSHDLASQSGNLDHVVIGAGSVFLLDSKNLFGEITMSGDSLIVKRPLLEESYVEDVGKRARRQAKWLKFQLERISGLTTWVQSVVVLWGEFEQGFVEQNGVIYVHGDQLAEWLKGQRGRMSHGAEAAVREALGSFPQATWA